MQKYQINGYTFLARSDIKLGTDNVVNTEAYMDLDVVRFLVAVFEHRAINSTYIDVVSYKIIYQALRIMRDLELSFDMIVWNTQPNGRYICREYMYMVGLMCPRLSDFADYLRSYDLEQPIPELTACITDGEQELCLPEGLHEFRLGGAQNPWDFIPKIHDLLNIIPDSVYVDALDYYMNYPIHDVYMTGDQQTLERVKQLACCRDMYDEYMMINPYDIQSYFDYDPTVRGTCDIWKCDNVNMNGSSKNGESNIVPYDVAVERMKNFSCGWINETFALKGALPAGGAIMRILNVNYNSVLNKQSDIDIFIHGENPQEQYESLKGVLEYFETPKTLYAVKSSLCTVYIMDVTRKFQIVSSDHKNMYRILSKFDMSHVQWAYFGGKFYGTPAACKSLRTYVSTPVCIHKIRANRLIKTLCLGFDILKTHELKARCDISDLIADKNNIRVRNLIKDLHKYYYPMTDKDLSLEDQMTHIKAMIGDDAGCSNIVNSVSSCLNSMQIGGSFEGGYDLMQYSSFDIMNVENKNVGGRNITLMCKHGPISTISDVCEVIDVICGESISVKLRIPELFQEFLTRMLDGVVYSQFVNTAATKKICQDDTITLIIPHYKYANQQQTGFSLMKNQRGEPLDIQEDLNSGDRIQFMFKIVVVNMRTERCIKLDVTKIFKHGQAVEPPPQVSEPTTCSNIRITYEDI